jgi:hypothetical protein
MPAPLTRPASQGPAQHAPLGTPKHVRVLTRSWGVFMLAMAGVNGWLAATGRADVYAQFADGAYLDLYRDAWRTLVEPHPLPWVLALTAFEAAAGAATLTSGRARLLGLGAATVFIVALTPGNADTLVNPLLAVLPAYLFARHLLARREAMRAQGPQRTLSLEALPRL